MLFVPAGNLRALLHEDFLAPFWCEVNAISLNKTLGTQTALMRNYSWGVVMFGKWCSLGLFNVGPKKTIFQQSMMGAGPLSLVNLLGRQSTGAKTAPQCHEVK